MRNERRSRYRSPLTGGLTGVCVEVEEPVIKESLTTTSGVTSPREGERKASEARKDREKPPRAKPTANGGRYKTKGRRATRGNRPPTAGDEKRKAWAPCAQAYRSPDAAGANRGTRANPATEWEEEPNAACEYGDGIKGSPAQRGGATAAAPRARPPYAGIGEGERRAGSAKRARRNTRKGDIKTIHAEFCSRFQRSNVILARPAERNAKRKLLSGRGVVSPHGDK